MPHRARLHLMSDLHIGSAFVDHDMIRSELSGAAREGARVLINGDVFDAILPSDRKRYDPRVLCKELQGRADPLNAALDFAIDIFSPYVDAVDVIGCGNHDTALEKHHSLDLVSILIHRLNTEHGGKISYGGYEGYYRWQLEYLKRQYANVTLRYHHGSGGAAPVTKGLIDFARLAPWMPDADVIWIGHKHNRLVDSTMIRERMTAKGRVYYEPVLFVMTGGYFDRAQQTSDEALKTGRFAHWAADMGMAPQRKGGITLAISVNATHRDGLVTKVQAEV